MKICVVMFYTENIKSYGDINYLINKHYCDKYDITLFRTSQKSLKNRNPMWERIPLILKHLPHYEYVIWIDADAFFYENAKDIRSIIQQYPRKSFIFSNDRLNNHINTGFFIVKNNPYSKLFLKEWCFNNVLKKLNPYPCWPDQGVLIYMYRHNLYHIKKNSICISYGDLQHFPRDDVLSKNQTPFVLHIANKTTEQRFQISNDYYLQHFAPQNTD